MRRGHLEVLPSHGPRVGIRAGVEEHLDNDGLARDGGGVQRGLSRGRSFHDVLSQRQKSLYLGGVTVARGEYERDALFHHPQRLFVRILDLADPLALGQDLLLELERAVDDPHDARGDDDQSEVVEEEQAWILGDEALALLLLDQLGGRQSGGLLVGVAIALGRCFRGRSTAPRLRRGGGGRLVFLALAVPRRRSLGSLLLLKLLDRRLDAVLVGTNAETHAARGAAIGYEPLATFREYKRRGTSGFRV